MKPLERFPVSEDPEIYYAANEFLERGLRVTALRPQDPVRGVHVYDVAFRMKKGEGELTIGRQINGKRTPADVREEISIFNYGGDGFTNTYIVHREGLIDPESEPTEEQRNNSHAIKRVGEFLDMYEGLITHPEDYPNPTVLEPLAFCDALAEWRRDPEENNDS